jgi:hypothetical protein
MTKLPESRLLAIVALGVACFSAGFSVTASAYANLSDGRAHSATAEAAGELRSCARR